MLSRASALRSRAASFLEWWLAELGGMIPRRLRDSLNDRRRLPTIDVSADGDILAVTRAGRTASATLGLAGLPAGTSCHVRIPAASVVGKVILLPAAAAESLAEILRFQIEQETPFRAEDVYFDHAVIRHDRKAKRIAVDWRLAPRRVVDRATQSVAALGLGIASIGVAGSEAGRFSFHRPGRDTRSLSTVRLRQALAVGLGALTIAAIALPLARKHAAMTVLTEELAQAQAAAEGARVLRQEIETLRATHGFILDRRWAQPTMSVLLRDLTDMIPDDTWLRRLTVQGAEVAIAGVSPSSSSLVERIETHPGFEQVAYRSPTLRRGEGGLEEFDLTLRIVAGGDGQ